MSKRGPGLFDFDRLAASSSGEAADLRNLADVSSLHTLEKAVDITSQTSMSLARSRNCTGRPAAPSCRATCKKLRRPSAERRSLW